MALVAGAFGIMAWAVTYGANKGDVPHDTKTVDYIVQAGDTPWSIAVSHDTRDDTRSVIAWMDKQNHLTGSIQPGQTILVPIGR